jgi:hypothetical protein
MSEEFERAEGVLDELIPTIDASKDCVRSDFLPFISRMIYNILFIIGNGRIPGTSMAETGRYEKKESRK